MAGDGGSRESLAVQQLGTGLMRGPHTVGSVGGILNAPRVPGGFAGQRGRQSSRVKELVLVDDWKVGVVLRHLGYIGPGAPDLTPLGLAQLRSSPVFPLPLSSLLPLTRLFARSVPLEQPVALRSRSSWDRWGSIAYPFPSKRARYSRHSSPGGPRSGGLQHLRYLVQHYRSRIHSPIKVPLSTMLTLSSTQLCPFSFVLLFSQFSRLFARRSEQTRCRFTYHSTKLQQ
jgi:hypothetical protein